MVRLRWSVWLAIWLAAIPLVSCTEIRRRASWPNGPLVTSGRWINDATGTKVTYAGVNWSGSLEAMIPEGLQYQSIEAIVSKIKSLGMNAVRLTYAIEMIDQYYDNDEKDITIQKSLTDALGDDGEDVLNKILANNPSFTSNTGRLEVFDAIAAECAKQEIYLHLDNHVSKATWCCSPLDGNSWFNDTYFNVENWTRGLSFMADRAQNWTSLTSMALRNELRIPLTDIQLSDSYNWETWYKYMRQGADAIHSANADTLIFLSGLNSDANLTAVVQGTALLPGSQTFSLDDFSGYGDKIVLELHEYANILGTPSSNCTVLTDQLYDEGFSTLSSNAANQLPMVVTEFGFVQNSSLAQDPYPKCILDYFTSQHTGWMIWSLSGSYYIREGTQDYDEQWGLLTHDWSSFRAPSFVTDLLKPAVNQSLAAITDDGDDSGDSSGDGGESKSAPTNSFSIVTMSAALAVLLTLLN